MRFDNLYLWYLGVPAQPHYIGRLQLVETGKGVSLAYSPAWLTRGFALSEDLPLVDIAHLPPRRLLVDAPRAVGAIDDARPDRWGEKVIRFVDRPKRLSLMEYLYLAGDDRFGALGVSTSAHTYEPRSGGPLPQLGDVQRLSEVVARIEAAEPISAIEARILAGGGSPLGGAKPKALIDIDSEQWIIKFYNGEPVDSPLVEHATMTLARHAGINAATTRVVRLKDVHALCIRRFDRTTTQRLHCLSAATVIRAAGEDADELGPGYPALARLLRRIGNQRGPHAADDTRELFRRMVFNILIDNTDDHEKNHALIATDPFAHGTFRLAPAFDVLPTNSGQGYQEFVCGAQGRESTLINAISQCTDFGLAPNEAAAEIEQVIGVVNRWQTHFRKTGVSESDIRTLAEYIDSAPLLSQRRNFDRSTFSRLPPKRRRPSPFH